MDEELVKIAIRNAERAMIPMAEIKREFGSNVTEERKVQATTRTKWEQQRAKEANASKPKSFPGNIAGSKPSGGRSALSSRATNNGKPDVFMPKLASNGKPLMPEVAKNGIPEEKSTDPERLEEFAKSKKGLEDELAKKVGEKGPELTPAQRPVADDAMAAAEAVSSEIVAKAGAGAAFEGSTLGIGGLDDVLAQVKRRIWVPLAAPPTLLNELGINPVRGLLLYGLPGCGKTLLARSLGSVLSPTRPITVVSGPEIMDRFVGSSEANLREIFDNPPEIYDTFRIGTKDNGAALEKVALHVIILDEFDAMARARGGRGGDQGDAGVARDSVVNQLLAKMDGVDHLVVPTLVIGMTNRRTLIEPALLRPGRFEVQIEVPKPKTVGARISILNVHMNSMFKAGRLFVSDAPAGSVAAKRLEKGNSEVPPTYDELLNFIAVKCDGFSGASLAGVARAAASHALERAVCDYSGHLAEGDAEGYSITDCLVTKSDIEEAIEDVLESSSDGDGGEVDEVNDSSDEKKEEEEEGDSDAE
jgi:SpoVK/Ycf46/Vps4 family AAA+-type ATPase